MKVFVVDDSKAMRLMVVHHIRQAGFTGHKIMEFPNGKEALDAIATEKPDVILSDWNMPIMTGYQLLIAIKTLFDNQEIPKMIPFVFITSESTEEMKKLAREGGSIGIITKPFNVKAFETHLMNVLD